MHNVEMIQFQMKWIYVHSWKWKNNTELLEYAKKRNILKMFVGTLRIPQVIFIHEWILYKLSKNVLLFKAN